MTQDVWNVKDANTASSSAGREDKDEESERSEERKRMMCGWAHHSALTIKLIQFNYW